MTDDEKLKYERDGQKFFEFVLRHTIDEVSHSLEPELEGHLERERKPFYLLAEDGKQGPILTDLPSGYMSCLWRRIATESMRTAEVRLLDRVTSKYFELALKCATGNAPGAGPDLENRLQWLKGIQRTWESLIEEAPGGGAKWQPASPGSGRA